jgi:hypothetical protein
MSQKSSVPQAVSFVLQALKRDTPPRSEVLGVFIRRMIVNEWMRRFRPPETRGNRVSRKVSTKVEFGNTQ